MQFTHRLLVFLDKLQDHLPEVFIDRDDFFAKTHQPRLVNHRFPHEVLEFVQLIDVNPDGLHHLSFLHRLEGSCVLRSVLHLWLHCYAGRLHLWCAAIRLGSEHFGVQIPLPMGRFEG